VPVVARLGRILTSITTSASGAMEVMSQVRSRVSLLTPPVGVPQLALAPETMRLETKPPPG